MYTLCVVGAATLFLVNAVDYVRCAWIRRPAPVLATWILMAIMMWLSFWMYWTSPTKSFTGNISVTTGLVSMTMILAGVIAAHLRHGTLRVAFDSTQLGCLCSSAVIVALWFVTEQLLLAYVLVQLVALIGLFATAKKLWRATHSSEPLFSWVLVMLATLCAIYPAWVMHDQFAWIYLARAIPSTTIMLYLMVRIKYRQGRLRPH